MTNLLSWKFCIQTYWGIKSKSFLKGEIYVFKKLLSYALSWIFTDRHDRCAHPWYLCKKKNKNSLKMKWILSVSSETNGNMNFFYRYVALRGVAIRSALWLANLSKYRSARQWSSSSLSRTAPAIGVKGFLV